MSVHENCFNSSETSYRPIGKYRSKSIDLPKNYVKINKKEIQEYFLNLSMLEVPPGFEPGNEGFADLCLTTWPRYRKNGAGDEARTRYLHLGKVALYQMSYTRRLQAAKPLQLRQNPTKRF